MASITKLPSGAYRVQIRRKGRYASETFLRRDDAHRWARQAETRVDQGLAPNKSSVSRLQTFGDLIDLHITDMCEVGKPPRRSKAATLATLKRDLGKEKIGHLDRQKLIDYGKMRADQGAGPVILGIDIGVIKMFSRCKVNLYSDRTFPKNSREKNEYVMASNGLKVSEVFTPNDTPTVSYVGRDDLKLESNLKTYFDLPKMVVSISGPSKSGKTVLIKKVLAEDLIIPVIGSGITTPEDLWTRALQWMEAPTTVTTTKSSETQLSGGIKGGGEAGIPFVAKGKAEAHAEAGRTWGDASSGTTESAGLTRVIKEISGSEFVVFVDDFHYIKEKLRDEVGRQIKVAADNGVKIVTASVPHRADDVVRSNPELRGRVAAVDLGYWDKRHLLLIARQGFGALNVDLAPSVEQRLCDEAMGSPQLMQTICFCLCQVLGINEPLPEKERVDVNEDALAKALSQTSHFTDFSKMLTSLHSGPKTRGQERKEHQFVDGTSGDVYRAVLLAIRADPIAMTFSYDDLMSRIKAVCSADSPVGSSVTSCLEQMHLLTESLQPGRPVLAWDGDNLDITDPYFAFFLRCSDKINTIAK